MFRVLKVTLTKPNISVSGNAKRATQLLKTVSNLHVIIQLLALTFALHVHNCLISFVVHLQFY